MVQLKSERELKIMRRCGQLLAEILGQVAQTVKPGVRLSDIDQTASRLAEEKGVVCAFKGFRGFPSAICTSVNEQIVHGIATDRELVEGDIVGLDFGLLSEGFYTDSAVTLPVGEISPLAQQLMQTTAKALYAAIDAARPGNTLKDLARAVEATVRPHHYGIVREFVGHGIGQRLHEDPQLPNYEAGASNLKLRPGMTIAIEPMINAGTAEVQVLSDKWTAVTTDGSLSAHYEHTIAVREDEPEVLTEWGNKPFGGLLETLGEKNG